MHVDVRTIDAVVVVAASGPESHKAALEGIAAVDPSSCDIPMRQVRLSSKRWVHQALRL